MKKILLSAVFIFTASFTMIAQVGVGTTTPEGALDVTSATTGLVLPRVANTDAVTNPQGGDVVNGTMVYDMSVNCVKAYPNGGWSDCLGAVNNPGPGGGSLLFNDTCASATISATPCTAGELSSGIGTNASDGQPYEVVQIGDQCWMAENIDNGVADSGGWTNTDTGWYGYYGLAFQANKEGTLFQWSAAMNGSTAERAQGVCPAGWHVPSDCEWMYLENTLGMSTTDQQIIGWRGEIQGRRLKVGGISGFEGILVGLRNIFSGNFQNRGIRTNYWSSSSESASRAYRRSLISTNSVVYRSPESKAYSYVVRCLKD